MSLTTLYATPTPKFDVAKGRLASQEAERLAAELGDHEAESKALWNLMNLNVYGSGDPREALEAGERSLALARELDAREQIALTMTDLWRPYVWVGDLAAARRTLEDARPIWRELDNLPMLTENLASSANVRRFTGDDDQALALAIEARSVAESIGNLWGIAFACMASAEVYLDRGDVGGAIDLMRDAIEMGERVGFLAPLATTRAALAVVYASLGDHGGALRTVEAADEVATERLPSARPAVLMALAQIHLLAGELAEAEARLAECDVELLPEAARTQASLSVPLVEGSIAAYFKHRHIIWRCSRRQAGQRASPDLPAGGTVAEGEGAGCSREDVRSRRDAATSAVDGRAPGAPTDPLGDLGRAG